MSFDFGSLDIFFKKNILPSRMNSKKKKKETKTIQNKVTNKKRTVTLSLLPCLCRPLSARGPHCRLSPVCPIRGCSACWRSKLAGRRVSAGLAAVAGAARPRLCSGPRPAPASHQSPRKSCRWEQLFPRGGEEIRRSWSLARAAGAGELVGAGQL